jgi:hypothetical protein
MPIDFKGFSLPSAARKANLIRNSELMALREGIMETLVLIDLSEVRENYQRESQALSLQGLTPFFHDLS